MSASATMSTKLKKISPVRRLKVDFLYGVTWLGPEFKGSPGLLNGLKGLQPRAPKVEGPPKPRQKLHIEFYRRHAMQCFMCVQCVVIVDCRVSAVITSAG